MEGDESHGFINGSISSSRQYRAPVASPLLTKVERDIVRNRMPIVERKERKSEYMY